MIDAGSMQAIAAMGALIVAIFALASMWTFWIMRRVDEKIDHVEERIDRVEERIDRVGEKIDRVEERMGERMDRMEERMEERAERRHAELLAALSNHTHGIDGEPAVFHRLPGSADD